MRTSTPTGLGRLMTLRTPLMPKGRLHRPLAAAADVGARAHGRAAGVSGRM